MEQKVNIKAAVLYLVNERGARSLVIGVQYCDIPRSRDGYYTQFPGYIRGLDERQVVARGASAPHLMIIECMGHLRVSVRVELMTQR